MAHALSEVHSNEDALMALLNLRPVARLCTTCTCFHSAVMHFIVERCTTLRRRFEIGANLAQGTIDECSPGHSTLRLDREKERIGARRLAEIEHDSRFNVQGEEEQNRGHTLYITSRMKQLQDNWRQSTMSGSSEHLSVIVPREKADSLEPWMLTNKAARRHFDDDWLLDESMNTHIQALRVTLLEEGQTDVGLMPAQLSAVLMHFTSFLPIDDELRIDKLRRAARWTKRLDWASTNFVMTPVHYKANHWFVLVWNRLRSVIEMYDSMRGPNQDYPPGYTARLLESFREWVSQANSLHERLRGLPKDKQAELPSRVENCSRLVFQQRDGHNCGVSAHTYRAVKARGHTWFHEIHSFLKYPVF